MREATGKCLRDTFCSESMSHVRYLIFAGHAQDEAFPAISRLFRAFALAKYLRAAELYYLSRDLLENYSVNADSYFVFERTMDHLVKARDSEANSVREVFEPYLAVATAEAEAAAENCLARSVKISRTIADIAESVLLRMQRAAEEPALGDIYICSICGDIALEAPPEECPCCGSSADDYLAVV